MSTVGRDGAPVGSEEQATLVSGTDGSNRRVLLVDSAGSFVPGTGASSGSKAAGSVAGNTDTGTGILVERRDTADPGTGVADGDYGNASMDANGGLWTSDATLTAGENLTTNRTMVQPAYTYSAVATADVQVLSGAGVLHSVTFSCNDAAPTAGSIIIFDSLTETGTQVFNHTFTNTPFVPFTVVLDYIMTTGIYLGFTTTADVNVSTAFLAGAV